jgi:cytochrome c2
MRPPPLVSLVLVICFFACTPVKRKINNPDLLASLLVTVDPKRDTTIYTSKGAIIEIPKDAIEANGQPTVQMEIKEAYDVSDMIKGGLLTESDGKPLSSGGMIYIRPTGEKSVRITKPIKLAIPTASINDKMLLYKGEVKSDGKINWQDSKSLPNNPQLNALNRGKQLFINNCASCHGIGQKVTGPDLAHIVKGNQWMLHYPWASGSEGKDTVSYNDNLLYYYTRNNNEVLKRGVPYFLCLFNDYGSTPMTLFPSLTDEDLDNLYAYIENESTIRNLPVPNNGILACYDSCSIYSQTKSRLEEIKASLEKDSVEMREIWYYTSPNSPPSRIPPETGTIPIKVAPLENKSLYYQFKIDDFGWYNVDMAMQLNVAVSESRLQVHIQGQYLEQFNVYLVIPEVKMFGEGGPLETGDDTYGFYLTNGMTPLPQNARAYILAMGEYQEQIIFGKKEFITSRDQRLNVELQQVSKEKFQQEINSLSLNGINIRANDTKKAAELRKTILNLKNAEDLKPKNCDCACFPANR